MKEGEVLIIGAGPAGMAAAMELSKAKKNFTVVEKDSQVGGLSKTYAFKEDNLTFLTDNGPHRFFSKNQYLYSFIEELLHEKWIKVRRQTRQFIEGKFYDYPINAKQALVNVGVFKAARMVLDYGIARIQYGLFRKKIENFDDYIVANFGRTLGEFNMLNYTEKIWGIPCTEIHSDWAKQRIKGLNLRTAAWNAILTTFAKKQTHGPKSLVDAFYYPEHGTGEIYETIRQKIEKQGHPVLTNSYPTKVKHSKNKITDVILNIDGKEKIVQPKYLVESIHITDFLKLLDPQPPKEVMDAMKKLRYRSQAYLFITLNKKKITDDQWIYFPDRDVPIGRVSEMRNFSEKMSPPGKTSLFVEFFCNEGDDVWNMDEDELFELALPYFEKYKFFTKKEVRKYYVIKQRNVYPIYDIHYQRFVNIIKKYLDKFDNLFYIGRPGRFRYNNQDHSLEMGMLAAQSIIDGKKYNIGKVGDEEEYYESGKLPPEQKKH
ncbi:MAG TPA: FAD-dependent oxidoreductase [Candidatus Nanoarchaeia archaeon]|nr:FAD-dependent oxidoreductase [Candidatus Nanoarchaeia archaeon]